MFRCPSCYLPLTQTHRQLRCANNHSFDLAKEGYANLLLAHKKRSKAPGDSQHMMRSRQQFLSSGAYEPLIEPLARPLKGANSLLDIGCGEGYYAQKLQEHGLNGTRMAGIDIAKEGVKLAAKRKIFEHLAVASAYDLPFNDNSFDVALSIFSPIAADEVARILKPSGKLVTIGPGENHLRELAEFIYNGKFKPHKSHYQSLHNSPGWALETQAHIAFDISLAGEQAFNLLAMTPYYWSCSAEKQKAISQISTMNVHLEFHVNVFTLRA